MPSVFKVPARPIGEEFDITPDPRRTMSVIQREKNNPEHAIHEAIRNIGSWDPKATVRIKLYDKLGKDKNYIEIIDRGHGIEPDVRPELFRLGAKNEEHYGHGDRYGKNGHGFKSLFGVGDYVMVVTQCDGEKTPACVHLNIGWVKDEWKGYRKDLTPEEIKDFKKQVGDHGAIVRIGALLLDQMDIERVRKTLRKDLGLCFCEFIRKGLKIYIDDDKDPIEMVDLFSLKGASYEAKAEDPKEKRIKILKVSKKDDVPTKFGSSVKMSFVALHGPHKVAIGGKRGRPSAAKEYYDFRPGVYVRDPDGYILPFYGALEGVYSNEGHTTSFKALIDIHTSDDYLYSGPIRSLMNWPEQTTQYIAKKLSPFKSDSSEATRKRSAIQTLERSKVSNFDDGRQRIRMAQTFDDAALLADTKGISKGKDVAEMPEASETPKVTLYGETTTGVFVEKVGLAGKSLWESKNENGVLTTYFEKDSELGRSIDSILQLTKDDALRLKIARAFRSIFMGLGSTEVQLSPNLRDHQARFRINASSAIEQELRLKTK